jgi:hypothetical protein
VKPPPIPLPHFIDNFELGEKHCHPARRACDAPQEAVSVDGPGIPPDRTSGWDFGERQLERGIELRRRQAGLLPGPGNRLPLNPMKRQQSDLVVRTPLPSDWSDCRV